MGWEILSLSRDTLKLCNGCKRERPLDRFHLRSGRPVGVQARCKDCTNAVCRAYYAVNKERVLAKNARWKANNRGRHLEHKKRTEVKARYGLTIEKYREILALGCGICGGPADHLDHDHKTGVIRGPLCEKHNLMIGLGGDDPKILRAAAGYLEVHLASRR